LKYIYHICKTPHNDRETRKALGSLTTIPATLGRTHLSSVAVYHSFSRFCGNESRLTFLTAAAWETVNETRGNDLGYGNNDKDEEHKRPCLEIGNPRENRLSPIGRTFSSLWQDMAVPQRLRVHSEFDMAPSVPRVSVEDDELATLIPLKV
jgi:hypothetical protein